jgi:hypothetical protein
VTYAADALIEEAAYLAYRMHWTLDDVLDLEHADRQRFIGLAERFRDSGV